MAEPHNLNNPEFFKDKLYELEILKPEDGPKEIEFFSQMFYEMLSLFTQPIQEETFDFSNADFFNQIAALGEKYAKNTQIRKMNGNRGSEHFIYINRTFFGLYNLMFDLKSQNVKIKTFFK